jgi:hypothetical protein
MGAPFVPGLGREGESAALFVAIGKLKKQKRNPRSYKQEHILEIAESIRRFGFGSPIIARSVEDPTVMVGHVRLQAAEVLGLDVVPVRFMAHLSEPEALALTVADNALAKKSSWDDVLLEDVMREIRGAGTVDMTMLGFSAAKLDKLFADAPPANIIDIDVSKVRDQFFLSVRGDVPAQPEVLARLRDSLAELPGVVVQVGMVKR